MNPKRILPLAIAAGAFVPIAANAEFDVLVRDLLNASTDNQINNTTEAETILALGAPAGSYDFVDSTDNPATIDYGNNGGSYSPQNAFPSPIESNDDYAIRATANIMIPAGDWTIGFGSDDGGMLKIPGITFLANTGSHAGSTFSGDEVRFEGTRAHNWTFGTFTTATNLLTTIEAVMFERGGGDSFEVALFNGHTESFNAGAWALLADGVHGWAVQVAPLIDDSDGDGLDDLWEDEHFGNNDGNPTVAELALQDETGDGHPVADGDGLLNAGEFAAGSDPNVADTDGDTLNDGDEVNVHSTNPASDDSDGDLVTDDVEVATAGYDPLDKDSDDDGLDDGTEDANRDGVKDPTETDATNPDTDGDKYIDGYEADNNPPFDPLVDDSSGNFDGDTLDNAAEWAAQTDPLLDDTDADGVNDDVEVATADYDPLDNDSDDDGLLDGEEDVNGDGIKDPDESDATNPDTDSDSVIDGDDADPLNDDDTDNDGILNSVEGSTGENITDPLNPDTDGDGLEDGNGEDTNFNGTTDAGETDPTLPDTDGDGFDDGLEVAASTDPLDDTSFPGIEAGIAAYWPMDGDYTDLISISGTPADGSLVNNNVATADFVAGQFGEAANLFRDGTSNEYIEIDSVDENWFDFSTAHDLNTYSTATGDVSISAWFRVSTFNQTWQALIAKGESTTWRVARRNTSNGLAYAGGSGDIPASDDIANMHPVNDNAWHHVVAITEGGVSTRIWVDNVLVATGAAPTLIDRATNLMIGANPDTVNDRYRSWNGEIDDVALWSRPLTEAEVGQIWNGGSGASIGSLIGLSGQDLTLRIESSGADLIFTWDSKAGKQYDLLSHTDLTIDSDTWPVVAGAEDLVTDMHTIPHPGDSFRYYVLREEPVPPTLVFEDDFESDLGWTTGRNLPADTGTTIWERGTPAVGGIVPDSGANGSMTCFGTNIEAVYGSDTDIYLRSPVIDLSAAGFTSAVLRMQHILDTDLVADVGSIRILDSVSLTQLGADLASGLGGEDLDWQEFPATALPAEAMGKTIILEFQFIADDFSEFGGWYIDNVAIEAR